MLFITGLLYIKLMEHLAFEAVVTCVTLPYFCDSGYICDSRSDVQDSMVWCKKARHEY